MKKLLCACLASLLVLSGCGSKTEESEETKDKVVENNKAEQEVEKSEVVDYTSDSIFEGVEPESIDNFIFDTDGKSAFINAYRGDKEVVVLPDTYRDMNITKGTYTFEANPKTKAVKLGKYIEKAEGMFGASSGIEFIEFNKGLKVIGEGACNNCENLKKVIIPDTVESLEYLCFGGCTSLKSVEIPASVKKIDFAFFACSEDLEIIGEAGSAAEKYAKDNNFKFTVK